MNCSECGRFMEKLDFGSVSHPRIHWSCTDIRCPSFPVEVTEGGGE